MEMGVGVEKMKKNILSITLVVSFILSMSTIFASPTRVYIDPPSIIDQSLKPGDTFTIKVSVAYVEDLYGYDFKLRYDTNVLDAKEVVSTSLFPSHFCIKRVIDDSEGYVWVACILPLATETGVSGNGSLETITFQVKSKGESDFHFFKSSLGDHTGEKMTHEVEDGYFSTIPGKECKEKWTCTDWSECVDEKQTRTCFDLNECGTEKNKPKEEQKCRVKPPRSSILGGFANILSYSATTAVGIVQFILSMF